MLQIPFKPLTAAIALALFVPVVPVHAQSQNDSDDQEVETLATMTVSANRRQEELQSFSGSVTPMTAEQLDKMGADSMEEFFSFTPGVSYVEAEPGRSNITIRGIGTTIFNDQGQQTTGLFIDDVPLTEPVFNFATPDLDTFDINRVEVLRGPQGTAFGSGTLGGAVNYITNKPRHGVTEGRIQIGLSDTKYSDSLNNEIKGMFNTSLSDNLAMRVVATSRYQDGWMTNVGTGEDASNETAVYGGRLLLDWRLSENTSLSWMSLYQQIDAQDFAFDRSDLGRFTNTSTFTNGFATEVEIHSAKLSHFFDQVALDVSLTSKQKTQDSLNDVTANPFFSNVILNGQSSRIENSQTATVPGMTFEARLTSMYDDDQFEWSAGVFYDRTEEDINVNFSSANAAQIIEARWADQFGVGIGERGVRDDVFFHINAQPVGTEKALFGEMSWRFTDQWKATLGGRFFSTNVKTKQLNEGFFYLFTGSPLTTTLDVEQKESGFSPKGVLTYNFNDNHMVYGLVSKGFRYGGPNPNPPTAGIAATYDSDSLWNYELGYRATNDAGNLMFDLTAYRINWSDLQLRLFDPVSSLAYADNVGEAKSQGLEAALAWKPSAAFDLRATATWSKAELKQDFQQNAQAPVVAAGTKLPGSSDFRFSANATYSFDARFDPFITASYSYQSEAPSQLTQQDQFNFGDYSVLNLRGGLRFTDSFAVTAYVSNATNEYGVTSAGDAFVNPPAVARTTIRPRTYGILLDYSF